LQIVQKQIAETEEKIGEVQNEFAKTLDVMSRAAMSRATAEVELGLKLSHKLSTARIFTAIRRASNLTRNVK
jgi:hypothetical protein